MLVFFVIVHFGLSNNYNSKRRRRRWYVQCLVVQKWLVVSGQALDNGQYVHPTKPSYCTFEYYVTINGF